MKRVQYRLGSNKWKPLAYKGGQAYNSLAINGLASKGPVIEEQPQGKYIYILSEDTMYNVLISAAGDYTLSQDCEVNDPSIYSAVPAAVTLDADGRGQWGPSTQSRHSNTSQMTYYMSKSNYHVANGVAWMKISWRGLTSLTLKYGSYSHANDYTVLWKLDFNATSKTYSAASTMYDGSAVGNTFASLDSSAPTQSYTYTCDTGEHFCWVLYGKDRRSDQYEDRGYIGVETSLLQSQVTFTGDRYYTVSEDEYFVEDDVYREKLIASDGSESIPGNII